jgi:hypothetical protein
VTAALWANVSVAGAWAPLPREAIDPMTPALISMAMTARARIFRFLLRTAAAWSQAVIRRQSKKLRSL